MLQVNYQDTWINGAMTDHGERDCLTRYRVLQPLLSKYRRRFSILDIGASLGYFSFRAASDYDCVCVMIEKDTQPLLDLCRSNNDSIGNVIFLNRNLAINDLEQLSTCEHFDVVLALNILHHFSDSVRALNAVLKLGDRVIIESPSPADINACGQSQLRPLFSALCELPIQPLCSTVSHVTSDVYRYMTLIEAPKRSITKQYLDVPNGVGMGEVSILSTFSDKTVTLDRKNEHRPWIEGINLRTYDLWNGVWPSRRDISNMVLQCTVCGSHGDIKPWNFVLDGKQVHLIDGNDGRVTVDDNYGLQQVAGAFS